MQSIRWILIILAVPAFELCAFADMNSPAAGEADIPTAQSPADANDTASALSRSLRDRLTQDQPERPERGSDRLFYQMAISIALVLGLGAIALWLSKKVVPRLSQTRGKHLKLVETLTLGTRAAVHIIEAGDRKLVIGVTGDRITRLAELNDFSETLAQAQSQDGSEDL